MRFRDTCLIILLICVLCPTTLFACTSTITFQFYGLDNVARKEGNTYVVLPPVLSGIQRISVYRYIRTDASNVNCSRTSDITFSVEGGPYSETKIIKRDTIVMRDYASVIEDYILDFRGITPGTYEFKVETSWNGRTYTRTKDLDITVDATAPVVTLTNIAPQAELSGTLNANVEVEDEAGTEDVQLLLGNAEIGFFEAEYYKTFEKEFSIDLSTYSDGAYELKALATDGTGNVGSYSIPVTVNNVNDPPEITLISPADGSTVAGNTRVRTDTIDDSSVKELSCYINGQLVSTDTSTPYDCVFDTTTYLDGAYQIGLIALDNEGLKTTKFLSLLFRNTPNDAPAVTLLTPSTGQKTSGKIDITVDATDDVKVKKVDYFLDELFIGTGVSPTYNIQYDSTSTADGIYTLKAVAYDYSDLTASSTAIITIQNGDVFNPQISFLSPEDGSTFNGEILLQTIAIDNVAIKEVHYFLDDNLLAVRSVAPYKYVLASPLYEDGDHIIRARAYDYTNNFGETSITLTFDTSLPEESGTTDEEEAEADEESSYSLAMSYGDQASTVLKTIKAKDILNAEETISEKLDALVFILDSLKAQMSVYDGSLSKRKMRKMKKTSTRMIRYVNRMMRATAKKEIRKRKRRAARSLKKLLRLAAS